MSGFNRVGLEKGCPPLQETHSRAEALGHGKQSQFAAFPFVVQLQ